VTIAYVETGGIAVITAIRRHRDKARGTEVTAVTKPHSEHLPLDLDSSMVARGVLYFASACWHSVKFLTRLYKEIDVAAETYHLVLSGAVLVLYSISRISMIAAFGTGLKYSIEYGMVTD